MSRISFIRCFSFPAHRLVRVAALTAMGAALVSGCATAPEPAFVPGLAGITPAPVEPMAAAVGPLTVEDAVERAVAGSGEVMVLRAAVRAAEQRRRAATDLPDPELRLSYSEDTTDNLRRRWDTEALTPGLPPAVTGSTLGSTTDEGDAYRVGVRLFPPNPWIRSLIVSARTAELNAAKADLQAARWRVAAEVRRLFAEIRYLTNDVLVAGELVRFQGEILKVVKSSSEQGQATAADLMTASRRYLQAVSGRDRTRQQSEVAKRMLAALVNLPTELLRIDAGRPPALATDFSLPGAEQLERIALRNRADISALYWRKAAARAAYREARNSRIPWLRQVDLSYAAGSEDTAGSDLESSLVAGRPTRQTTTALADQADSEEWRVDAAINIPLFPWTSHASDVTLADLQIAEVNEAEGMKKVSRELRSALDDVIEVRDEQARYNAEILPIITVMQTTLKDLKAAADLPPDEIAAIKAQILESIRYRLETRYKNQAALIGLECALGVTLQDLASKPQGPSAP